MTQISFSTSAPTRGDLQAFYDVLERRAVWLMDGWENRLGVTPDDLAQSALESFLALRTAGHAEEDAAKIASYGMQQDHSNLMEKVRNRKEDYFELPNDLEEDYDDESLEAELAAAESAWIYFPPDVVDQLASLLTPRELEAVILVFESDLTHEQTAARMHIARQRVDSLLITALDKLREVWPSSQ